MSNNTIYMKRALELAQNAFDEGEIPVGAVIVKDDEILGFGYNQCEKMNNSLLHAEMLAIEMASKNLGNWRLSDCTMYVTLEPCPMCSGAIINSRLGAVVFGAYNEKTGCCTSAVDLFEYNLGYKPKVIGGFMQEQCLDLIKRFFENKRK